MLTALLLESKVRIPWRSGEFCSFFCAKAAVEPEREGVRTEHLSQVVAIGIYRVGVVPGEVTGVLTQAISAAIGNVAPE